MLWRECGIVGFLANVSALGKCVIVGHYLGTRFHELIGTVSGKPTQYGVEHPPPPPVPKRCA